jgi:Tol biopolymer transport system component
LKRFWKPAVAACLALVATQLAAGATGATNGNVLAFTSFRGGNAALYVASGNGTGAHRLTTAGVGAYQGDVAWSPDGTRLAFTCGNFELCVASADGTGVARLTTSMWPASWSYDFEPAWSPDGTRIVFNGKRGTSSTALWLVNADGTGIKKLVDSPSDESHPDWSPDGLRIVYDRSTATDRDLWVVNADGTGARSLTSGKAYEADPDWSPDGATIAYQRGTGVPYQNELWLMSATGGGQRRLIVGGQEPSWAPDGSLLHFSGPQGIDDELFSIRADGTGRTRLTKSSGGDYTPQLQPEGVIVTLPPSPVTPLASVHADARVVGTFLARAGQLDRDLSAFETEKFAEIVAAARALQRDAGAGLAAVKASRPVSARGNRIRTESIAGFTSAQAAARNLLEIIRLAPQGKKVAKRIAALDKQYQANLNAMDRRLGNAFRATGF